jgi:hypothetical protein
MKSCPVGVPRKIIKDSDTQRLKKHVQGNLDSLFSSGVLKKDAYGKTIEVAA